MEALSIFIGLIGLVIAVLIGYLAFNNARKNGVSLLTGISAVAALVIVFVGFSIGGSFGQVSSGHIGLQRSFGGFTGKVFQPGLYTTTPILTSVDDVDVQNQHKNMDTNIITRDNQNVPLHISINYNLQQNPAAIVKTLTYIGDDYYSKAIESQFIAATKQVGSQYNLTDFNSKLDVASNQILADTERRVRQIQGSDAIAVTQVSIKGLDLSDAYKHSIEQKVIAQQEAQKAQIEQQKVQFETNQKVIQAKGQAEAQRYQSRTINDEYLKLQTIELKREFLKAWDGHCSMIGGCPDFNGAGSSNNGNRSTSGPIILDARNLAEAMVLQQKQQDNQQAPAEATASPDPGPSPTDEPKK